MGKVLIIVWFLLAIVLLWKSFGPPSWGTARKRGGERTGEPRQIKGPDDDEEFLWQLDLQRFKQRRAREAEQDKQDKRDEEN